MVVLQDAAAVCEFADLHLKRDKHMGVSENRGYLILGSL